MRGPVSRLIASWRTGLSRPVLILQAGNALNYFGYGLILPFEIIYLHQIRGFSASTAGLVLAAIMGTAAISTPPTGGLLDRYSAKAIVLAGSLAQTLGYAGFAFVDRPWLAFACAVLAGVGNGAAGTANRTLVVRLVRPEQRAAAFALNRVAGNVGIGAGATVAGFLVASAQRLSSFQILYFLDAVTFAGFALIVLAAVPSPRAVTATATDAKATGFRAVARDRLFLTVIAANIVLVVVGHTFFSNILPPFAKAHTPLGPAAIGILNLANTSFVGLPMIEAFYGSAFLGIGILVDQLGTYMALSTIGVLVATLSSSGRSVSPRVLARRIAAFPPFQALALGLVLVPFQYPEALTTVLDRLGGTVTPLALVSVGYQLRLGEMRGNARPLAAGLLFKLVLGPALVATLFILGMHATGKVIEVTVFEAAMGPQIGGAIVAMEYGLAPQLVTLMVGVGIPLSLLTAALWCGLLGAV